MTQQASQDEIKLAGIAYAGLILCLIPTVLIFVSKKDQSRYVQFHCLQAVGFALIAVSLNLLFGILGFVLKIIPFIGGVIGGILGFAVVAALFIAWIAITIQAFQGKDVRIPLLADYIQHTLMK